MVVKILEVSAMVSLVVGSVGLLANMFFLHWGTTATLVFAAFNVSGLIDLAVVLVIKSRMGEEGE